MSRIHTDRDTTLRISNGTKDSLSMVENMLEVLTKVLLS